MGYDEIIPHMGGFGRYQKRIYFLVCLPSILGAFHKLAGVFLLAKPDHRCQLPFETNNSSFILPENIFYASYPIDSLTKEYSKCEYLDSNYSNSYFAEGHLSNKSISCDKFIYDKSKYPSNVVGEWDLVCSRAWIRASSDSLFMFGVMVGSIIFGALSDRYGRKPIFLITLVIQVVFGIAAAFAPEYMYFLISRIIIGSTTSGGFLVAYVIAMEMVGPKHRMVAGVVMTMFFSFGYILLAVFAYFIDSDWRMFQLAISLPGILFFGHYWFMPESTRWLISKNKNDEAIKLINRAAKQNNVTVPQEVIDDLIETENRSKEIKDPSSEASVLDLFKQSNLRRKSLIIFFDWAVNSGTYYGLSWNTNNLGGNDLLNYLISGLVEFPAYLLLFLTLNRWGRKKILCGCMLTAGTFLLLTIVIPKDMNVLIVSFAMLGKLAITASYATIYVFSAEQFPTVIRNVGMGAASTAARVGSILAPYCNLLGDIWQPLPLITFGALSFIGGFLSLLLPETHNKKLPETIADAENFGKRNDEDVLDADEINELNSPENGKF